MSYDYHLPADLYCWGQDRGGTLEMMIAHCCIMIFNSGPLFTSSIVHYLILVAGLAAAFHFVRKPFYRFALSIAWFFPSYFFIENVIYQFGIQFSMFMIGVFFLSKAMQSEKRKLLLLSLAYFFMILNAWILDLGFIPFVFLPVYTIYYRWKARLLPSGFNVLFSKNNFILFALWTIAGASFIAFAKSNSSGLNSFSGYWLNNPNGIFHVVLLITHFIGALVVFRGKPMESCYVYAAIIFLIFLAWFAYQNKNSGKSFFRSFFLWQSIFTLLFLLLIRQVQISNVPSRYFAGCYLSFSVFVMMKLDELPASDVRLKFFLFLVLTFSAFSSLYESYFPKKLSPMVQNFRVLEKLEPVGIIGTYWNSYVFSGIDPVNIKATPHEGDNVRNINVAYETLEQPTLLLIQNEWLAQFPDSITQFGSLLRKNGTPFLLGTYISWEEVNPVTACEYKKYP